MQLAIFVTLACCEHFLVKLVLKNGPSKLQILFAPRRQKYFLISFQKSWHLPKEDSARTALGFPEDAIKVGEWSCPDIARVRIT